MPQLAASPASAFAVAGGSRAGFRPPPRAPMRARASATAGGATRTAVQQQPQPTFYDLLGISAEGSTFEDVRAAYRRMARKYHPDVSPPDAAKEHTRRFIQVQEAYETLSDPSRRTSYDRALARGVCRLAFSPAARRHDASAFYHQVHAWLFHSKDSISGNSKTGVSFWGQIADTFNSTSAPSRHRTAKQLKDHWNVYNREVTLFNGYYTQEEGLRQSGADDEMVMKAAMARYENDKRVTQPFRRLTWWQAVRNEQKWKGHHGPGSGSDSTAKRSRLGVSGEYSSGGGSEDTAEEQERPLGRDRGRVAARKEKGKRKGKESSSSSEVGSKTFEMKNMWSGLVKAKLLKQWNKMKDRSTTDMDEEEKRKHAKAMKMVEAELGLDDDED